MSVSARALDKKVIRDVGHWLELQAYLNQQGVRVFKTLRTISISFETQTASDEFHRFILQAKAKR